MKTLIIYCDIENPIKFLIIDGDYSKFNGVCVNAVNGNGFEDEFIAWFFSPDEGDFNFELSEDVSLLINKKWDTAAICTFLP